MTQDEQHLHLLSIFHYVCGGITALFSCLPFIYVGLGIAMLCGAFERSPNPPEPFVGWFLIFFGGAIIACGWTLAILMFVVGKKLRRRTSRMFCLVVAGIECIIMPFGTVLGAFTIIVLVRDSVKALFAGGGVSVPAGVSGG